MTIEDVENSVASLVESTPELNVNVVGIVDDNGNDAVGNVIHKMNKLHEITISEQAYEIIGNGAGIIGTKNLTKFEDTYDKLVVDTITIATKKFTTKKPVVIIARADRGNQNYWLADRCRDITKEYFDRHYGKDNSPEFEVITNFQYGHNELARFTDTIVIDFLSNDPPYSSYVKGTSKRISKSTLATSRAISQKVQTLSRVLRTDDARFEYWHVGPKNKPSSFKFIKSLHRALRGRLKRVTS